MNHDEIARDLETLAGFINAEVTERADDVSFDDAVELHDRLQVVVTAAQAAMSLLDTQKMRLLEKGSKTSHGRRFARVPKEKSRTDHVVVRRHVIDHSLIEAAARSGTGEIEPRAVANLVADSLFDLYVSPSTPVKATRLEKHGVPPGTPIIAVIHDGWKIEETRDE